MTYQEVQWRCRRSILELDVLLSSFFQKTYHDLTIIQQKKFIDIILLEDQELMTQLFYQPQQCELMNMIRVHLSR
jgi:succinate dehydrogenase flavin-adding protein (antitoxin of CptAB toxin-antitoxin module)